MCNRSYWNYGFLYIYSLLNLLLLKEGTCKEREGVQIAVNPKFKSNIHKTSVLKI